MSTSGQQIGILGGSFNPVHAGHLMLASWLAQFTGIDRVWLMLSPANPLKTGRIDIAPDADRLEMLNIACRGYENVRPCDIELSLPRPSFTFRSLNELSERHPDCRFRLIIGSDNWLIFNKWKNHTEIIQRFSPIIYPRPGYDVDPATLPSGVLLVDAPIVEISSTFIRHAIAEGGDMKAFLPPGVAEYILTRKLYRNDI